MKKKKSAINGSVCAYSTFENVSNNVVSFGQHGLDLQFSGMLIQWTLPML